MSGQVGPIDTPRQLREQLEQQRRTQRRLEENDVIIEGPRRIFIRSASGHFWRLDVADDGSLSTTDMGTTL